MGCDGDLPLCSPIDAEAHYQPEAVHDVGFHADMDQRNNDPYGFEF
jgi:hypothetical protein